MFLCRSAGGLLESLVSLVVPLCELLLLPVSCELLLLSVNCELLLLSASCELLLLSVSCELLLLCVPKAKKCIPPMRFSHFCKNGATSSQILAPKAKCVHLPRGSAIFAKRGRRQRRLGAPYHQICATAIRFGHFFKNWSTSTRILAPRSLKM